MHHELLDNYALPPATAPSVTWPRTIA